MEKLPELEYHSLLAEPIRDYLDYLDHLGFRVVGPAYALGRLDRFLVDHQVESFDQHDPRWLMTRLMDQYQGRFKGQTLQAWRQAFQGLCRYLVRRGWMKENPLADFPLLRPQPYRPYVFSPGELRRFFDCLQQRIARAAHARALYRAHCHYTLYHLLYACGLRVSEAVHLAVVDYSAEQRTLYNTGARASELCALRLADLDFHQKRLLLQGKGHKARTVPLWDSTLAFLRTYLKSERRIPKFSQRDFLFINQRGTRLTRSGLYALCKHYLAQARAQAPTLEHKRLHPVHLWRYTTASHLLLAGVDITVIQEWLGHASVDTTCRYKVIPVDAKREALEKFYLFTHLSQLPTVPGIDWSVHQDLLSYLQSL